MDIADIRTLRDRLATRIGRIVVGQEATIDLTLIALLARGHILLEGVPGTAKTLLARTFAASFALQFGRVQFTPDLMPGDVVGTNLFDFSANRFILTRGPVFSQVLLADEINRSPAKTQSALLEAMQERTVTIDGVSHPLDGAFLVIATQNPLEHEGTYPLPEAQLDRFLFKQVVGYPSIEEEEAIVTRHGGAQSEIPPDEAPPLGNVAMLHAAEAAVASVRLDPSIVTYIVGLIRATREHPLLDAGASPRAGARLAAAARARAALDGRDYVVPDDVKALAQPALRHRVILGAQAEIEGTSAVSIVDDVIGRVPAPR